ncbi:MAG: UDP-N-acetylmuramoyl-L-alanine--D-glutamate ligase [Bacteroidales bacterium]
MSRFIVVLGGGESGVGAAVLAREKGFQVMLSDINTINEKYKNVLLHYAIDFEENGHTFQKLVDASEVIKSPGIPDTVSIVRKLKENGIPVISEIEFAGRFCRAYRICISGSNGKTTTALLTEYILRQSGKEVVSAGNMGNSFASVIAGSDPEYVVLELSSFQLEGMYDFKADIAVLTNIVPDHLDRYGGVFQRYVDAKFRILQNQTGSDHLIYNADDPLLCREIDKRRPLAKLHPLSMHNTALKDGAFINENNEIIIDINNKREQIMTIEELALQGKHNIYNSMAGGVVSRLLEIRKETIKTCLSDFQNIEHRLEYAGSVRSIDFINDSKATNVNSSWYALETMNSPVIWIAGGVDKGNDYSRLRELVREKVKGIVCLGVDNKKLIQTFSGDVDQITTATSAWQAVSQAYYMAEPGDVVLLSPACASFDLFENFEDRGNQFKNAIRNL